MAEPIWRIEKGALVLKRHAGQRKVWQCPKRFIFMLAGTQGGKTSFGPWWLAREIRRCGPGDYLAVSSTVDLARMKMLPALRETFEWVLRAGTWRADERTMQLYDPDTGRMRPDGTPWARIILRSAAADGGLESATAKAAWLDECGQDEFTLETWEAVLRRLSLAQGRVLGTTTPYNLGWMKTEVYDRWRRAGTLDEREGDADFAVVQYRSTLNPSFPRAEYERARATMPGWRFQMFYEGEFGRPAGQIYDCYLDEPGGHLVEDFEPPAAWPRFVGVDFGAVHTALVWLAKNPSTGVHYLYRESLEGGLSTNEHAAKATRSSEGENVAAWYGGAASEEQQRWDWTAAGVPVLKPPVSDVEAGIDRVTGLFKLQQLRVFRSCEGTRRELADYSREVGPDGQPTEKIARKEEYHRLDALRYAVAGATGAQISGRASIWE